MADSKRILEISGKDWVSGISTHPYMPVGGLFQQATNFDPFEKPGVHVPSQAASTIGTGVVVDEIKWMVSHVSSAIAGVNFVYGFSNSSLYNIRTSNMSVVDQTARLQNPWIGNKGATIFKNRIIMIGATGVVAGTIPLPTTPVPVVLLSNLTNAYHHQPHVGPDRNLYICNLNKVARITSVTGKADNDASFLTFEEDVIVRGLSDDGVHLIIVGDTNSSSPTAVSTIGSFRSFVAFWNMKGNDLTRIWGLKDVGVFGVQVVEDEVIVHGKTNIYTCSVGSKPRVLMAKEGNSNFAGSIPEPGSIIKKGVNIALWGDELKNIYGYGRSNASLPKSLFTVHSMPNNITRSIFYDGGATDKLIVSNGTSLLYAMSGITTPNNTSTTKVVGIDFKQPYEFSFAKVVLDQKLDNGQSVDLEIISGQGDNVVLRNTQNTDNSFSNSNFPGKKSHIFYPQPGPQAASSIALFEDLSDIQIINKGASIRRFEIWGKQLNPSQDIHR